MIIFQRTTGIQLPSWSIQIDWGWYGLLKPYRYDFFKTKPLLIETIDFHLLLIHVRITKVSKYGS